jgi:hypothetical protein
LHGAGCLLDWEEGDDVAQQAVREEAETIFGGHLHHEFL